MNARFIPPGATGTAEPATRVLHAEFSWLDDSLKNDTHAQFVALTYDITRGAEILFQVAHNDFLDRDAGQDTMFSNNQIERLTFMATRALQLLGAEAERMIEVRNQAARKVQA